MNNDLENDYKKLKEMEQIRKDLTSIIIHDLNNPLSAIDGGIQLVKMEGEEKLTDRQRENLDMALLAARDLQRMIANLTDIDRIGKDTLAPQHERFNMKEVAREVIEEASAIARYDEKTILLEADDHMPSVSADRALIRRVIANLIHTAVKATPPKSSVGVEISYKGDDNRFYVRVKDSGKRIPKEYLDRVFDQCIHKESDKKIKANFGLGLTFSKMIVELHGGKIGVADSLEGGNVFTFTLPQGQP